MDGDEHVDVLVGSSCNSMPLYVMFGDSTGLFSDAITLAIDGSDTRSALLVDLDNDGQLDVVAGTSGAAVVFYAGDGSRGFAAPMTVATLGDEVRLTVADLDDDGANDIVATAGGGVNVILADP